MNRRRLVIIFLLVISSFASSQNKNILEKNLTQGEALIFYLFHSGWAVKTQNHFFIFDYWEKEEKPEQPSLLNGFINPSEIASHNVFVFVSHRHYDHYDPTILKWKENVKNIKYIFGWKATDDSSHFYFQSERKSYKTDDIEIFNIHHKFDGIPESAFLIFADGLSIYHAGDHGHSKGQKNDIFRNNIDYLAKLSKKIDIVFTPTFGGQYYTIEKLSPEVVFPMHNGGYEQQYEKFANKVKDKGIKVKVGIAQNQGDCFLYLNGKLEKLELK